MAPRKYVEKMIDGYINMFGEKPKTKAKCSSPLEKGDHPELDVTDFLDETGIQKYQSIVGSLQWAVSIGRMDVTTAVMTLSSFRAVPRIGHLKRAKRVVCYLAKMKHAVIRFRTTRTSQIQSTTGNTPFMGTLTKPYLMMRQGPLETLLP